MKNKLKRSKKNKTNTIVDPLADDLTNYILEGDWKIAQFELREKKDKVLSLRLSDKLLSQIKRQAKSMGLDTQKFVRIVLENSLRKKAS